MSWFWAEHGAEHGELCRRRRQLWRPPELRGGPLPSSQLLRFPSPRSVWKPSVQWGLLGKTAFRTTAWVSPGAEPRWTTWWACCTTWTTATPSSRSWCPASRKTRRWARWKSCSTSSTTSWTCRSRWTCIPPSSACTTIDPDRARHPGRCSPPSTPTSASCPCRLLNSLLR